MLTSKFAPFIPFTIIIIFTTLTVIFYFKRDKYEPEPINRIILAFVAGIFSAVPALILSILINSILTIFTYIVGLSAFDIILPIIVVAPFVEELTKIWFVILLSKHESFDGPLDGLIYGAIVGAGFAFAENLLYAYTIILNSSLSAGIFVAALRSITQIVGHPFYTGLAGVGVGEYKVGLSSSRYNRVFRAIGVHALWNISSIFPAPIGFITLFMVVLFNIYVLRKELKRTSALDKIAFDRGYYDQKHKFLQMQQQTIDEQIYGPRGLQNQEIQQPTSETGQAPQAYTIPKDYDSWQFQPSSVDTGDNPSKISKFENQPEDDE